VRLSGLQAKGFLAERPTARPVPLLRFKAVSTEAN
jgi:hypothetical protein